MTLILNLRVSSPQHACAPRAAQVGHQLREQLAHELRDVATALSPG